MPLRRLLLAHLPETGEWRCTLASCATHPDGGLAVTERSVTVTVSPTGSYRLIDIGDLAEAMQQRMVPESEVILLLRALDILSIGLDRTRGSVPDLLALWEVDWQPGAQVPSI